MGSCDLPDMYALRPAALGLWAYISGKSLMPMLQLLHVYHVWHTCICMCKCACLHVCMYVQLLVYIYRRRGKICWAKYSHSFSVIRVFTEILACFLGHNIMCSFLVQLKRGTYIHGKTFTVLLKSVKNAKV